MEKPSDYLIEPKNSQNDPVKEADDPVKEINDPVKVSILQQLQQKSNSNYAELAAKVGCSAATIKRHIQELKKLGFIERVGSDKTGYWKIV